MPTLTIPFENENTDSLLRRFRLRSIKSGIFSDISKKRYHLTRSQKRRLKSAKAKKRDRKNARLAKRFEKPDDLKPKTIDPIWPETEQETIEFFKRKPIIDPRLVDFELLDKDTVQLEPTISAFGIGLVEIHGINCVILVEEKKNPKDGNKDKGSTGKVGFPGGGFEPSKDRDPEDTIVREFREEAGLDISKPSKSDIVFLVKIGAHEFRCYKVNITGGGLKEGKEIEKIHLVGDDKLASLAASNLMFFNHKMSLVNFLNKQNDLTHAQA